MDKLIFLILILLPPIIVNSQYTDDSDYDDFSMYEDSNNGIMESPGPDDFYIIPEEEVHNEKGEMSLRDEKLERVPEKIYQYTKHRIPGYDYDELDFVNKINIHKCDEKSIWTHCLCQFTCTSKNTVDCYTPCTSGCECKEDFVFDEESQICIYPDQCSDIIRI